MMIADGVIAVSEGHNIDSVEAALIDDQGETKTNFDDAMPYSHLDLNTAALWAEQDEMNRRLDFFRLEPESSIEVDY